jgi:phage tail sheath protein FI
MPEYLAPGVYVEETSFRAKSIEGVSTTTTGFVGPARYGPIDIEPDIVTSITEFERTYGDRERLQFSDFPDTDNYLWHGARAFFEEGGKRLYIARVFHPLAPANEPYKRPTFSDQATINGENYDDGHARDQATPGAGGTALRIAARFPGAAGNMRVRLTLRAGQNSLGGNSPRPTVTLQPNDLVVIHHAGQPTGAFYTAERYFSEPLGRSTWRFKGSGTTGDVELTALRPDSDPLKTDLVRVVTMTVTVTPASRSGSELVWEGLALHPKHERAGTPDSVFAKFGADPNSKLEARTLPIVVMATDQVANGIDVVGVMEANEPSFESPPGAKILMLRDALFTKPVANTPVVTGQKPPSQPTDADLSIDLLLKGGNDGERPKADDYRGAENDKTKTKTGLVAFEDIEDISIVAAPGSTYNMMGSYRADATSTVNSLISHAQRMRYRIAVLDSGDGMAISEVREMRAKIDSTYAALYYPWVRVLDPVTGTERVMPPSGFVTGIYARNDINRAVYKAPANEVVVSAIGFETLLNKSQQDVLNPEGINCFRFFEGRGFRLWGARTISSDPEWKYVNLRRYFAYLEHSIDRSTQWAVFEPNGEALWANVRRSVEDFLLNEWQMGALLGDKPEKAFFVKCDRSTMSQNDLDNGRMVCLIGVVPLRPAEFVIFRVGQWTADRKV